MRREILDNFIDAGEPACAAFWHNELFALMYVRGRGRLVAIVSQSGDGELLARVLEGMDIATARGSSSRGGVRAMVKAAQLMRKESRITCFAVDGPRGPRHVVKDGVIHLARLGKVKIVPIRIFMNRCKIFASWDRFQLPLPFSRVEVSYGPPFDPSNPEDMGVQLEGLDERELVRIGTEKLKQKLEEIKPANIKAVS